MKVYILCMWKTKQLPIKQVCKDRNDRSFIEIAIFIRNKMHKKEGCSPNGFGTGNEKKISGKFLFFVNSIF